ncbi:MAG: V-type ATP synthase subunit E family protein [Thermoproteota archaeon]|nr:V-type ATP synthase subunit E family protein [Thermoproteota archaeon]MDQ4100739.1 V-type ATP synthase subunit E family protein [Thermoproteota archaeon]
MSSSSTLEHMIDKVLVQKEAELVSQIDSAYQESLDNLESSRSRLEAERTRIVEGARKQAENLKRQIIGSARLASRNQELVTIENAVNKAFEEAKKKLQASSSTDSYQDLLKQMVEESISAVGTSSAVTIECNKNDAEIVRKAVSELREAGKVQQPAEVSNQYIDVLGGIRIKSSDGTMTYDNTLDSRIERLKPLIRKNIAQMLRGVE